MRVFRIELRRTSALVLGALVVLVVVGMLSWGPSMKNSAAWTRQWTTMAEWVRFMLMVAWPLALGGGALQGLRDRRSGVEELFGSTPRPRAQRVGVTVGAVAAALVGAYAVVLVVGGVRVASSTDYFHLGWLPATLVGVVALAGAGALGMGLGRLVPSPLTPPLLAAGGLALMTLGLGPTGGDPSRWVLLLPSLPMPVSVYASVRASVSVAQLVWFVGVALTGFLLVASRRRWLGLLPVLVAGAGTRTCYADRIPREVSREVAARTVMTAWLTGRVEPLPTFRLWLGEEIDALTAKGWERLRALPEDVQAARVQAAREVQAGCAGDALTTLTGGTT